MTPAELDQALEELQSRLDRLRSLYEQYFVGIEKIPPLILRKDVDRRIYQMRREQIRNTAKRFKLQTLIQSYNTYQQHWARICREIEEGRYTRHLQRAHRKMEEREALTIAARRRFGRKRRPESDTDEEAAATKAAEATEALEASLAAELEGAAPSGPLLPSPRAATRPERASLPTVGAPGARPSLPGALDSPALLMGRPSALGPPRSPAVRAAREGARAGAEPVIREAGGGSGLPRPVPPSPRSPAGPPPRRPAIAPSATRQRPPPPSQRVAPAQAAPAKPTRLGTAAGQGPAAGVSWPALKAVKAVSGAGIAAEATPPRAARPPTRAGAADGVPARAQAARSAEATLSRERLSQIHSKLVSARSQTREAGAVSLDGLGRKLQATAEKLKAKHSGRNVDFDVVIKEGRAIVKPIIR